MTLKQKTVLLVDDETTIVHVISRSYRSEPVEMIFTSTIEEVVEKMQKKTVDLIVMAVNTKTENSLNILRHLNSNHTRTPIILMTTESPIFIRESSIMRERLPLKNWTTIEKPFALKDVISLIDQGLSQGRFTKIKNDF